MMPRNSVTEESEREMEAVRALADDLGLKFDEVLHSGSQGTFIGIQAKSVMYSQRLDSYTFFVQDARYGSNREGGVLDAPDDEHVRLGRAIAGKLKIPSDAISESKVLREQTQTAQFDRETGKARMEDAQLGKAYVLLSRRVEGIPVWSSRLLLGLTRDRGIGFLEAHWPEIPKSVLAEAKRLAEKIKAGWKPPEQELAKIESVEAGIIHSPAAGFILDIYPAIRVIYASLNERIGKKMTLYLDRHGESVPIPRQFDKAPDAALKPREKPGQ